MAGGGALIPKTPWGGLPLRVCFLHLRPIPPLLRDERWGLSLLPFLISNFYFRASSRYWEDPQRSCTAVARSASINAARPCRAEQTCAAVIPEAPRKSAPARFAPSISTSRKIAPLKYAPRKSVFFKSASSRMVPLSCAPVRFASPSLADDRSVCSKLANDSTACSSLVSRMSVRERSVRSN